MARGMTIASAKVRPFVAPIKRGGGSESTSDGDRRGRPFISIAVLPVMMVIGTEMMLFSGLIGSFLIFRLQAAFWPPPGLPRLPIAVTWVNTFVLLTSGVTMYLAVRSVRRNRLGGLCLWLGLTALLGTAFLAIQGREWVRLVAHGLHLSSGAYGATFYALI